MNQAVEALFDIEPVNATAPPGANLTPQDWEKVRSTDSWTNAKRYIAERDSVDVLGQLPAPVDGTELLRTDFGEQVFVIDEFLPVQTNMVIAAIYKGGKTTMNFNLQRSLVDGEPFLGRFETTPVQRVAVVDVEMDPRNLQYELRLQGIRNTDRIQYHCLRGQAAGFNLTAENLMDYWVRQLTGVDVLIVDCLKPILIGAGLNENDEAEVFLSRGLSVLAQRAGIGNVVVFQHTDHGGERARGDSGIQGWPDVNATLVLETPGDPHSPRYFRALGRLGVTVSEARLTKDERNRLYLGEGSREEVRRQRKENAKAAEKAAKDEQFQAKVRLVREALDANGGELSGRAVRKLIRDAGMSVSNGDEKDVIEAAHELGNANDPNDPK